MAAAVVTHRPFDFFRHRSQVRNQIVKELTESPDDVYLDYFPLAEPGKSGERRAVSVVVHKDIVYVIGGGAGNAR